MIKVSQEISVKGLLVYRFNATLIDDDDTRDQNVRTNSVIRDNSHPLNGQYVVLLSKGRYKVSKRRIDRYKSTRYLTVSRSFARS